MSDDVSISVGQDRATPSVLGVQRALAEARVKRAVGTACALLTKNHLNALPPNKMGWPSTGFYKGAARGTAWEPTQEGIVIKIDNENAPGAMRQRFHGGTITKKDKMLTIPARAEFYGQKATDFTNLRLVVFHSGAKALVIGKGGVGIVDFGTGKEKSVKGAGARQAMMVAYWLRDSVTQKGNPGVIPSNSDFVSVAKEAVIKLLPHKNGGHENV